MKCGREVSRGRKRGSLTEMTATFERLVLMQTPDLKLGQLGQWVYCVAGWGDSRENMEMRS